MTYEQFVNEIKSEKKKSIEDVQFLTIDEFKEEQHENN